MPLGLQECIESVTVGPDGKPKLTKVTPKGKFDFNIALNRIVALLESIETKLKESA